MFGRYTEKARRVIFFARYEASQFGAPYIETEHLLLGLLREDKALAFRFLRQHGDFETIRQQIESASLPRQPTSTSVDLPLSNESKRVLAYATEEAERLSHRHIGSEHLLLGMLREEKCFAAELLKERGLRLDAVREELIRQQQPEGGGMGGGAGFGITSSRRVLPTLLEFTNDEDGALIAEIPYSLFKMPLTGEEIMIGESRYRVVRLIHHFSKDADQEKVINPEKIEIRVAPLAS